jgi:hypothetical protein
LSIQNLTFDQTISESGTLLEGGEGGSCQK